MFVFVVPRCKAKRVNIITCIPLPLSVLARSWLLMCSSMHPLRPIYKLYYARTSYICLSHLPPSRRPKLPGCLAASFVRLGAQTLGLYLTSPSPLPGSLLEKAHAAADATLRVRR